MLPKKNTNFKNIMAPFPVLGEEALEILALILKEGGGWVDKNSI